MRRSLITLLTVFLAVGMLAGFAGPVAAQDTTATATVEQGDQTNVQVSEQNADVNVSGADDGDADNGDAPEEDDCSGECDDANDNDANDGETGDTNVNVAQASAQVNEQTQTAVAEATATDNSTTEINVSIDVPELDDNGDNGDADNDEV